MGFSHIISLERLLSEIENLYDGREETRFHTIPFLNFDGSADSFLDTLSHTKNREVILLS